MRSQIKEEITEIKKRLDILFIIYQNILSLLVKWDDPLPDEETAIKSDDELIDEQSLIEALK